MAVIVARLVVLVATVRIGSAGMSVDVRRNGHSQGNDKNKNRPHQSSPTHLVVFFELFLLVSLYIRELYTGKCNPLYQVD